MNKELMQLVADLNELNLENPDNSNITSQDWPFIFSTGSPFDDEISLHGISLLENPSSLSKQEMLEEILDELESWLPALQSAIWAVKELKKKY